MHRQQIVLAILCAVGGAFVALWWTDRGRETDEGQVSEIQRRLESVEGRVAAPQVTGLLQSAVASRDHVTTSPVMSQDANLPPGAHAGVMQADQVVPAFADPAAAAERRRYEAGVLEQALAAEQIDVAASNTFAQGLTQAFGGAPELAGNQLVNAQCRATLCRIAVLQRSDDDMESFLGNVGSLPGLEDTETYWQREINADGSSVMTMYVARSGHKLPDYGMRGPDSLANGSDGS
jgi:hypothetical protein